jgi:hypothetical protein
MPQDIVCFTVSVVTTPAQEVKVHKTHEQTVALTLNVEQEMKVARVIEIECVER